MADNSFNNTVESLFKGMDSFITTKTVVGDAIHIGDTIILPLVDVSFGVAAGAFSQEKKNNGAGGMGGKINPSAVVKSAKRCYTVNKNKRGESPMELQLHDRVKMKKPHPCGCAIFEVTRLGVDYKLKCTGCGREVLLPRIKAEKLIRGVVQDG